MTGNQVGLANPEGPRAPREPPEVGTRARAIRAFFPPGGLGPHVSDDPEAEDRRTWDGADEPAAVPVDPGSPSAENAAFVLLGALLTVFVLARVAGLV